jgi:hypothetical protein
LRHATFSNCGIKVENSSYHIVVSSRDEEASCGKASEPSWKKISGSVLIDMPQIGATVAEQINEDSTVESIISWESSVRYHHLRYIKSCQWQTLFIRLTLRHPPGRQSSRSTARGNERGNRGE